MSCKKVAYNKHLLAYIDIMGYKNMVKDAELGKTNPVETIRNLERTVKKCIKDHINGFKKITSMGSVKNTIDYVIFSDCICIWAPLIQLQNKEINYSYSSDYTDEYVDRNYEMLCLFILMILDIQMLSLRFGIIFRGAISVGNHYKSRNVMFSNALVKAYSAETNYANYPRIIIDNKTQNDFLNLHSVSNGLIDCGLALRDDDIIFIDYLGRINNMRHMSNDFTKKYLDYHKRIIEDNLVGYYNNETVLAKYSWLAKYHNYKLLPSFKNMKIEGVILETVMTNFNNILNLSL